VGGPRRRRWRLVIARAPLGRGRPRVRSPPARRRPLVPARAERHVDDVVQATWLRLLEDIRRLREPAAVAGWLETTTRRNAMRHLYGRNREELSGDPRLGDRPHSGGPSWPAQAPR
jgi:DNA-directed RNA polymerase specialized sigma24 family protein